METIKPTSITNHNRTDSELQAFWLFCMFVAGKNSDYAAQCLARLLNKSKNDPFGYLESLGENGIHNALVAARVGQYGRLTKGILQSLEIDLKNATLDDLMGVHGVGPKTARFFLLHTRHEANCAVLDTHILKWLESVQYAHGFRQTPQKKEDYEKIEKAFLALIKSHFPGMSTADVDLLIWSKMSGRLD